MLNKIEKLDLGNIANNIFLNNSNGETFERSGNLVRIIRFLQLYSIQC